MTTLFKPDHLVMESSTLETSTTTINIDLLQLHKSKITEMLEKGESKPSVDPMLDQESCDVGNNDTIKNYKSQLKSCTKKTNKRKKVVLKRQCKCKNSSDSMIQTACDNLQYLLKVPWRDNSKSILDKRIEIIKLGRPTPKIIISVSVERRRMTMKYINMKKYNDIPWIAGCCKKNNFYCWPCLLFNEKRINLNTDGTKSYKDVPVSYTPKQHSLDNLHIQAFERYKNIVKLCNERTLELKEDKLSSREDEKMVTCDNSETPMDLIPDKSVVDTILQHDHCDPKFVNDTSDLIEKGNVDMQEEVITSHDPELNINIGTSLGSNKPNGIDVRRELSDPNAVTYLKRKHDQLIHPSEHGQQLTTASSASVSYILSNIDDLNPEKIKMQSNSIKVLQQTPFFRPYTKTLIEQRINLIKLGRPTPVIETIKSVRGIRKTISIKVNEYKELEWLTGCSITNRLFCWSCLLFSQQRFIWNVNGTNSHDMFLTCHKSHSSNNAHIQAFKMYKSVLEFLENPANPMQIIWRLFGISSNENEPAQSNSIQTLIEAPFPNKINIQIIEERIEIIKLGRPKPVIEVLKNSKGSEKICIDMSLYEDIPWLTGCSRTKKLFCWPCLLFNKEICTWNILGTNSYNVITINQKKHSYANNHLHSCYILMRITKILETSDNDYMEKILVLFGLSSRERTIIERLLSLPDTDDLIKDCQERYNILKMGRPKPIELIHLYDTYDWLTGCSILKRMYCWPCLLMFHKEKCMGKYTWNTQGVWEADLNKFHKIAKEHETVIHHRRTYDVWKSVLQSNSGPELIRNYIEDIQTSSLIIKGNYAYNTPLDNSIEQLLKLGKIKDGKITIERLHIVNQGQPRQKLANNIDDDSKHGVYIYYNKYPWLSCDIKSRKIYCWPCLILSPVTEYVFHFKTDEIYVIRHSYSTHHIKAVELYCAIVNLQVDPNTRNLELDIVGDNIEVNTNIVDIFGTPCTSTFPAVTSSRETSSTLQGSTSFMKNKLCVDSNPQDVSNDALEQDHVHNVDSCFGDDDWEGECDMTDDDSSEDYVP